jgi:uncharacterized circularly permuted ATP-grasp superfamily protein
MEVKTEYFNEVFEPGGRVRERYRPLFEALERIGEEEFAARSARAEEKLRELGATFPLPDDPEGQDRILPADWIPRIIPKDHREILSTGLLQRGYAINAWLVDLYNGEQDVVPEEIVRSSVFYRPRPLPNYSVPIHVYGPDVMQLGPKEYVVLEDNVRVLTSTSRPPDHAPRKLKELRDRSFTPVVSTIRRGPGALRLSFEEPDRGDGHA